MTYLFDRNILTAKDSELVAFARAMLDAADWSAEQAIDFFAWPQKWAREYAVWSELNRPVADDPTWDRFVELVLGGEGPLREFLLEADGEKLL